jgi:hypothetical protein
LVAVVSVVADIATMPGFRGCAVRNTHAEFPDEDHPAHAIAIAYYNLVHDGLLELSKRAGAADPRTLADRIMLIIDGLNANGAARGREGAAPAAVAFAEEVVRQALLPLSSAK